MVTEAPTRGEIDDSSREPVCQLVMDDLGGERIRLEGTEAKHLTRSLRARPGERFRATDGRGTWAWLELKRVDRRGADLEVRGRQWQAPPSKRWWLATRASGSRFDWLVEKAVELGAWGLVPLALEGGERRGDRARLARWTRLARAALGQCLGAWELQISPPRGLEEVLGGESLGIGRWAAVVVADPEGDPAGSSPEQAAKEGDLLLVVGPPEGLEARDRAVLERTPDLRRIRLGHHRLRSETAALAGLVWACLLSQREQGTRETLTGRP